MLIRGLFYESWNATCDECNEVATVAQCGVESITYYCRTCLIEVGGNVEVFDEMKRKIDGNCS